MIQLFLDLWRKFEIGLVIFDEDYNILCTNKFVLNEFALPRNTSLNLLTLHGKDAAKKIEKMVDEARLYGQSHSYILKIVHQKSKKDHILLGKVFVLEGECSARFLAVLFDITSLTVEGQTKLVKIPVYDGDSLLFLSVEEIEFFKAAGNYTEIFHKHKLYLCPLSLAKIEKFLDDKFFFRVHRSFIVNLSKIKKLLKEESQHLLYMESRQIIPISKARVRPFLEKFGLK
ncbi:LytR/AlgR family response regulator transcription factor [Thermodesulfatator atlanticus]|uniref:LytR/AlgR family response regulator transcription factor n=1 Tax=Thermodesulfatator atlanticus TaxID=501497 RepID=UPI0003B71F61|nr:LytTR family DNA-binding domain-containing protein [Thermodesulfatator atlanticus]